MAKAKIKQHNGQIPRGNKSRRSRTVSSLYSVGQMNQLGDALERSCYTTADVTQLSGGDILANVLPLVRAYGKPATVTAPQHLIDCDAIPMIQRGLHIKAEDQLAGRVRGQLAFDPANVALYLSNEQQGSGVIKGHKLLKELASKAVYTANVLNYLLAHKELIPESWKGKAVFFFGTVYRDSRGSLYVRYLDWRGKQWCSDYRWLDHDWNSSSPVALRAS